MDALPNELTSAAAAARDRLATLAHGAAVAGTQPGNPAAQATMAAAAREAIFADALLSAMHARLEEFKSIAR